MSFRQSHSEWRPVTNKIQFFLILTNKIKYYVSSDGTKTPITNVEFTHLSNGLAKKYRDNVVLITMKGHIVCAKYGTIFDTFNSANRIAEFCWLVD